MCFNNYIIIRLLFQYFSPIKFTVRLITRNYDRYNKKQISISQSSFIPYHIQKEIHRQNHLQKHFIPVNVILGLQYKHIIASKIDKFAPTVFLKTSGIVRRVQKTRKRTVLYPLLFSREHTATSHRVKNSFILCVLRSYYKKKIKKLFDISYKPEKHRLKFAPIEISTFFLTIVVVLGFLSFFCYIQVNIKPCDPNIQISQKYRFLAYFRPFSKYFSLTYARARAIILIKQKYFHIFYI